MNMNFFLKINCARQKKLSDPLSAPPRSCFRIMDESGALVGPLPALATKDLAVQMYKCMVKVQVMDKVLFDAQRQGRLSFYMTSAGEEAASVASAAGLEVGVVTKTELFWLVFEIDY